MQIHVYKPFLPPLVLALAALAAQFCGTPPRWCWTLGAAALAAGLWTTWRVGGALAKLLAAERQRQEFAAQRSQLFEDLCSSLAGDVHGVQREIVRVRGLIHDATSELSTSFENMNRQAGVQAHAVALIVSQSGDRSLQDGVREVSAAGQQIGQAVAQAVRCLQFEDISMQALSAADTHARRLVQIHGETAQIVCGHVPAALNASGFGSGALGDWRQPPHKPVGQESMQEGSVELF